MQLRVTCNYLSIAAFTAHQPPTGGVVSESYAIDSQLHISGE